MSTSKMTAREVVIAKASQAAAIAYEVYDNAPSDMREITLKMARKAGKYVQVLVAKDFNARTEEYQTVSDNLDQAIEYLKKAKKNMEKVAEVIEVLAKIADTIMKIIEKWPFA